MPDARAKDQISAASGPEDISQGAWRDVLRRSIRAVIADDTSLAAAGVAFYAVWALFPAMVVLVVVAALSLGKGYVLGFLSQLQWDLPDTFHGAVVAQLDAIAKRSPSFSVGTIAGALAFSAWSAMRGVHGLITGLNAIYGEKERRSFWHRHAVAFALSALAGTFLIAALALIVAFAGTGLGLLDFASAPLAPSRWPILGGTMMLMLSVLYRYGPCRRTPKWRWVTWGATASAMLWLAASVLLSFFASHYGQFNRLLGSLATVMVFLLWCYVSVLSVLLGAHINAELERHTTRDTAARKHAG